MNIPKTAEYVRFVQWLAIPEPFRQPKTQKELAIELKVEPATLSDWKRQSGFWDEVKKESRQQWAKERTINVLNGLYRKAVNGNAAEAKLWFEIVEGWTEGEMTVEAVEKDNDERSHLFDKIKRKTALLLLEEDRKNLKAFENLLEKTEGDIIDISSLNKEGLTDTEVMALQIWERIKHRYTQDEQPEGDSKETTSALSDKTE